MRQRPAVNKNMNIDINNTIHKSNANANVTMTRCQKGGIKIKEAGNGYANDPFAGVNPFKEEPTQQITYDTAAYDRIDLNIANYSRNDLFSLFGLKSMSLTEDVMKECKKIVLKTHPDKSQLEPKYFLFFSSAYKKLKEIYDFQNKTNSKKTSDTNEYYESSNRDVLDMVFDTKKDLKDPKHPENNLSD